MSEHIEHTEPAGAPAAGGCEPMSPEGVQALRAYVARKCEQADQVAAVLEDLAANGLPAVEDCVPWEELREAKLMHCTRSGAMSLDGHACLRPRADLLLRRRRQADRGHHRRSRDPRPGPRPDCALRGPGPRHSGSRPELREYIDEVDDVRVIYFVTALRTEVIDAYVEA